MHKIFLQTDEWVVIISCGDKQQDSDTDSTCVEPSTFFIKEKSLKLSWANSL